MTEEQKRAIVQAGRRCERELQLADVYDKTGDYESVAICLEMAEVDSHIAFRAARA